jgi:hypothetical protein
MVNVDGAELVSRDYTRVAQTLIAIELRILEDDKKVSVDEPDPGLRASLN